MMWGEVRASDTDSGDMCGSEKLSSQIVGTCLLAIGPSPFICY